MRCLSHVLNLVVGAFAAEVDLTILQRGVRCGFEAGASRLGHQRWRHPSMSLSKPCSTTSTATSAGNTVYRNESKSKRPQDINWGTFAGKFNEKAEPRGHVFDKLPIHPSAFHKRSEVSSRPFSLPSYLCGPFLFRSQIQEVESPQERFVEIDEGMSAGELHPLQYRAMHLADTHCKSSPSTSPSIRPRTKKPGPRTKLAPNKRVRAEVEDVKPSRTCLVGCTSVHHSSIRP